jgi:DNA polymerase V
MDVSRTFGRRSSWQSSPLINPEHELARLEVARNKARNKDEQAKGAGQKTARREEDAQEQNIESQSARNSRDVKKNEDVKNKVAGCTDAMPSAMRASGTREQRTLYVLADADTFYASCERVFHPELAHRPVIVLSNNDGCVVTRSAEAKPYVPKGVPWFQIREEATEQGAVALSSNYELYGSLSQRMMRLMHRYFAHQEIYSIDECFLRTTLPEQEAVQTAHRMREAVWKGIGIPLSVGVAPTKTLVKIVNHWAKHGHGQGHVSSWEHLDADQREALLAVTPVSDVWGIGRRLTRKLAAHGIVTALELRDADLVRLRAQYGVCLARTVLELRGSACIGEEASADGGVRKQSILCSRMFGHYVHGAEPVRQALGVYIQDACRRLRRQHSLAWRIGFFVGAPFTRHDGEESLPLRFVELDNPSDDPFVFMHALSGSGLLDDIDPHSRWSRAGVVLEGLISAGSYHPLPQTDFQAHRDTRNIGALLDRANAVFGDHSVGIGWSGLRGRGRASNETGADWNMRRQLLSPRCTTRWDELPVVSA